MELLEEVLALYDKVSRDLDGLSHFHFAPKPIVVEADVRSIANVPSLSLEDVTPAMMSKGSAAAPEDVQAKKRGRAAALLADADLDQDDRKRMRRASKAVRRKNRGAEATRLKNEAHLKGVEYVPKTYGGKDSISNDKRVSKGVESEDKYDGKSKFTKSSNFFGDLLQQVQAGIRDKGNGQKRAKKNTATLSSASIKL